MITIELKVKHFFLIADILFNMVSSQSFSTLLKIKNACENKLDDDLAQITIELDGLFLVYNILTSKPEGQYNRINGEMQDLLFTQIQNEISKPEPLSEWIQLAEKLNEIRTQNLSVVDFYINQGKNRLYSM